MLKFLSYTKYRNVFINNKRYLADLRIKSGVAHKETYKDRDKNVKSHQPLPTSADVVVIGGGVAGCSTLYHLAKLGITNTVLLESSAITAGTTWHTSGLVWHLRPSDTEIELLNYSWDLMKSLEGETGVNTGYIQNGGLFIASTEERLNEYRRLGTLGKVLKIPSEVIGPTETKKLFPLMNTNDIHGCLYSPTDGGIDPAGYCTALVRGATRLGAQLFDGVKVLQIEAKPNDTTSLFGRQRPEVSSVITDRGPIKTNCIVLTAGCWSPDLAKSVGVKVPLCTLKHAYVVSERIEGIQNMPNVRDHDSSIYLRLQGDSLGIGGYEPHPIYWTPKPDFSFTLFELDWDVFGVNIKGATNRVPIIEKTGIKSTVCGPESFTADHKPLMGESPEVRGFFLNVAFNSAGMMLSGGCGREIARWVKQGRPTLDMFSYDIRRFSEHLTNNTGWINERSHEAYAKNYSIVYRNDEPLASRGMLKDVLFDELLQRGCMYEERQGFERPGWFSGGIPNLLPYDYYGSYGREPHDKYEYRDLLSRDYTFDFSKNHDTIAEECMATRQRAAIFNMSYFGKFYLTGPDTKKAVDWIFTANANRPMGSVIYTCICNEYGGTEADLTISEIDAFSSDIGHHNPDFKEKTFYLAIGGTVYQYVSSFINDIIEHKRFNCKLVDVSHEMVMLSIQGPKSREILQSVIDVDLSNEAFPFSTQKIVKINGLPCRALRLSFVGEMGWELHIPNENALKIYQSIMEAGQSFGIRNAGYRAIDCLSIEKGYRHWHGDLRSDDTPLEAGIGFTCKLNTDIDFLGRTALEKQKKSGLKKRLGLFSLNEKVQLHGLEAIVRNGEYVGFLQSGEYAHYIQKSIGYGYVKVPDGSNITNEYLLSGKYEIEKMGKRYEARFHPKTLFDPENRRINGIY